MEIIKENYNILLNNYREILNNSSYSDIDLHLFFSKIRIIVDKINKLNEDIININEHIVTNKRYILNENDYKIIKNINYRNNLLDKYLELIATYEFIKEQKMEHSHTYNQIIT